MNSQVARIQRMSEQLSIPILNLDLNPFDFPPFSLMHPPVGNAVTDSIV
jgi:hypothetical protein